MDIKREKVEREGCYNFYLKEDNQILMISFCGNLDLYWLLYKQPKTIYSTEELRQINLKEHKYTFTISKENYFIYSLFEELYNYIKESKIFIPTQNNNDPEEYNEYTDMDTIFTEERLNMHNNQHKQSPTYKSLFNEDIVEWHSDDDQYQRADTVRIIKKEESIELEFIRPKLTESNFIFRMPDTVCIRFRNSGSRYDPYNIIFMRMFQRLQDYDPEYHQIHIEEINYQKKLTLKK